jgi:hypothetical protein
MNASMYRQQEARNSSIRTGTHQVGTGLLRSIAQYHRQAWAFKYNGASFQRQRVTARPVFFFLLELRSRLPIPSRSPITHSPYTFILGIIQIKQI